MHLPCHPYVSLTINVIGDKDYKDDKDDKEGAFQRFYIRFSILKII